MAEPTTEAHAVYPEGPPCNPHCPGEWSTYHDGYVDGFERAEAEARATADAEILALLDRWEADGQGDLVSATAIRAQITEAERHG